MARAGTFAPGNKASAGQRAPRGRFITQRLIAMMHETQDFTDIDPTDPKRKRLLKERTTVLARYCKVLMRLALSGDMQAIKYIADRIEGTPIATTIISEDFDPEKMAAERQRLEKQRSELANMTDAERTALYFQTLRQADGISGPSSSH